MFQEGSVVDIVLVFLESIVESTYDLLIDDLLTYLLLGYCFVKLFKVHLALTKWIELLELLIKIRELVLEYEAELIEVAVLLLLLNSLAEHLIYSFILSL